MPQPSPNLSAGLLKMSSWERVARPRSRLQGERAVKGQRGAKKLSKMTLVWPVWLKQNYSRSRIGAHRKKY